MQAVISVRLCHNWRVNKSKDRKSWATRSHAFKRTFDVMVCFGKMKGTHTHTHKCARARTHVLRKVSPGRRGAWNLKNLYDETNKKDACH